MHNCKRCCEATGSSHPLAQELFPGAYKPTPTHSFMRLLARKGLLLRCFTQNIDSLERQAGTDPDLIVAAHGNFDSAACIKCRAKVPIEEVERSVMAGKVCHCKKCRGLVRGCCQLLLLLLLLLLLMPGGRMDHARLQRVPLGLGAAGRLQLTFRCLAGEARHSFLRRGSARSLLQARGL